ncbi:MAG: arsenic resistance N-acetyltransferase ArsN2 [Opitutaceae bacterium]|nr:arsenic resistance N-acetyltransferase ArsN2 [Opitutaceae bacterium]
MNSTSILAEKIEPARDGAAAAIAALLGAADLPNGDIEAHLGNFLVWHGNGAPMGAVGLEFYGPDALLRSLVVAPTQRGGGAGRALLRAIVELARTRGAVRLYLLTTTAASFFERLGFVRTNRGEVPPGIAGSTQFNGLCPVSATCMTARIADIAA